MDRDDPAWRGQSEYTPALLAVYDRTVLGPVARFVWRCPTERLVAAYRRHIREPHLDVGPGTGFFVDRSGLADGSPVTIVDPNPNVLRHTARRLRRRDLEVVQADVLKPLPVAGPFTSAALHLVLHCLPGPAERKATAVANVARVLAPDGVLFGASVLGTTGDHTRLARLMLRAFNRRGVFDNFDDSVEDLRAWLEASFGQVEVGTIGSIATFAAWRPREPVAGAGQADDAAVP